MGQVEGYLSTAAHRGEAAAYPMELDSQQAMGQGARQGSALRLGLELVEVTAEETAKAHLLGSFEETSQDCRVGVEIEPLQG